MLAHDGETIRAGQLEFEAIHTPGHTPSCYCYLIDGKVFVGDVLFMPDFGVSRCDFPKGSASELYDSIACRLYTLPDDTVVFTAHDYQPNGRGLQYSATIGESKAHNLHLKSTTSKDTFISQRTQRDTTLSAPRLIYPSLQINIDGGRMPPPEENDRSYLKVPIHYDMD